MKMVDEMPPGCEYKIQTWDVCVKKGWMTWMSRTFMDFLARTITHDFKSVKHVCNWVKPKNKL